MDAEEQFAARFKPYVPQYLSEVQDVLTSMVGGAPTFLKPGFNGLGRNLESEFACVSEGIAGVRDKLGEERYARLMALLAQAKMLFLEDQNDDNGKTKQGCDLLWDMDEIIEEVRKERYAAGIPDEEGEVTGD